jgi:Tol biopolymer transport system component
VVLASGQVQGGYAWSPSGRWVAVRHVNPEHGDKIYLVNADDPSQTVDVTHAEDVGQMFDPVWSPDGQTLVVFGVDDERPYAIDIASYLASKGLQP